MCLQTHRHCCELLGHLSCIKCFAPCNELHPITNLECIKSIIVKAKVTHLSASVPALLFQGSCRHAMMLSNDCCLQPDGHCMYRAVQDQLSLYNDHNANAHSPEGVTALRHKTADYIRNHKEEFLPFLTQVCFRVILAALQCLIRVSHVCQNSIAQFLWLSRVAWLHYQFALRQTMRFALYASSLAD